MKLFLTFCLSFLTLAAFAQGPSAPKDITVTGKVLEEGVNTPLEYATVSFKDKNGTVVTGGITDINGVYNIDVAPGIYTIKYEFISFKSKEITGQNITANITLPDVYLALDSDSLGEVIVRAETTEVQIRLDKKIYNIGQDLTTSGATVSDALSNVPSVTVDVDGAIALRGNENVRILINGKPSAIAGFGSTDALRQLPADAIERVEVITSPSARYDAEGTAGILNIILRKEKTLGFNGSIQANVGYPEAYGVSANINVRTDKFNVFNTTGINYRKSPGTAFFDNEYLNETATNPFLTESRDYDRTNKSFNTNLGMEYFLTDSSSLTGSVFLRLGDNNDTTSNFTDERSTPNTLEISRLRQELESEDDLSVQGALNYVNDLDDNGQKLTVDFQYEIDKEDKNSTITENNTFPINERLPSELVVSEEDGTEFLFQSDYVKPIGENGQFEAGFRVNLEETTTDYELLEEDGLSNNFILDNGLSNVFTYNEDVYAAYVQYGNKVGEKFSYLFGLRAENTRLAGEVEANEDATIGFDPNFDNSYFGLFPTANLAYELADRESITLGYNRRINRPRGFYVNPFPSRSSESNVFQGNPEISPAYANAFDLGYLKSWKKITLTTSIYYQRETDAFERIQEDTGELTPNGIPIIRTIPINLSSNDRYGFEAGILYNAISWLRLNGSFNYFTFKSEGSYEGVDYGTENNSWFARGSAKISLPAKIDWQTSAFYRGPSYTAQTESEGIFSMNMAFSKDLFNENATVGLNVSDLFNSRKRNSTTVTDTFIQESEFQWRERSVNLSFTYRFNQKKKRGRPEGNGGGGDEGEFEG
ncbi:TonB-dependent receptor domain protein [unidentified eubacterium SCB49]|nr:TonB-dependent receptor domain protein [unidentified eubacterium SCB49]